MEQRQFRILYREFLFRVVDRELLSTHAQGDASKFLGRIAALVFFFSFPFGALVAQLGDLHRPRASVLLLAWPTEHSLIATTMLLVGIFSVLSWDSMLPDRRDVLVLAPLPVRPYTMFLAKVASLAAALSVLVTVFNALPGMLFPFALAPSTATPLDIILSLDFYRTSVAYWITMFAAGAFILCCVLTVQGIAAQLPRPLFLRLSSFLQIGVFCLFVGVYFLQPALASPKGLANLQNQWLLDWLPSYWFLGLFQQLNGSLGPAAYLPLLSLTRHAYIGLSVAVFGAAAAFLSSYLRALRKTLEEPDVIPSAIQRFCLPCFGTSRNTAVAHFSIRSLVRSRPHRVILSFYFGMGFALTILLLKTSIAKQLASANDLWHRVNLPFVVSSFVMMFAWILGVRVVAAMPLELRANWIFQLTIMHQPQKSVAATRYAIFILALAPVLAVSALIFLVLWPFAAAVQHLFVLSLAGATTVALSLYNFHKIPFACSYLPGKSNLLMTFCLTLMLGLNLLFLGADFERRALSDWPKCCVVLATLLTSTLLARYRSVSHANSPDTTLHFEEKLDPVIIGLGLTHPPDQQHSASRSPLHPPSPN